MLSTILVPLDGSPLAERAVPFAERLSAATATRLVLCRVSPLRILQSPAADVACEASAESELERAATQLAGDGHVVETVHVWGEPAAGILEQVDTQQADLVVMATHGRSGLGRWVYGSVADAVLRQASVPVILLPPHAVTTWPPIRPPRIVVPLDGSDLAEAALEPAQALATPLEAELVLVQVVVFPPYSLYGDPSVYLAAYDVESMVAAARQYLDEVAARVRARHGRVRVRVEVGQPAAVIAQVAEAEQAGLIAMATHGRGGLARVVLGSVATGTLQQTRVPLLVVRPAALQQQAEQHPGVVTGASTAVAPS